MKTILINANAIESCIERENACLIKTKTGTLWVCPLIYKVIDTFSGYIEITTYDFIKNAKPNELLELPLKAKERE